jgi:hypothetical protein
MSGHSLLHKRAAASVTHERPHPLRESLSIDYTLHKTLQAITQEKLQHIAHERPQSVTQERPHPLPQASVMQERLHPLHTSGCIRYARAAASIMQERLHPLHKSGRTKEWPL